MNPTKLVAVVLIVVGALMLGYGGFSYTKEETAAKLGPLELSVKEKETVNVPVWAGVGAIVIGAALLVLAERRADAVRSPAIGRIERDVHAAALASSLPGCARSGSGIDGRVRHPSPGWLMSTTGRRVP